MRHGEDGVGPGLDAVGNGSCGAVCYEGEEVVVVVVVVMIGFGVC